MDPLQPIRDKVTKPLWEKVEEAEKNFEKGKPLHPLYSQFDGIKTLLFSPPSTTRTGSHIRDGVDLKRTMITVVLAMIPCLLHGIMSVGHMHFVSEGQYLGFFDGMLPKLGYGLLKVLPIVVVSYMVGLGIEFAFAQMRQEPISEGFLVSGMLIALVMPPDVPLWMVGVATAFAVIIGKEAFGGTGMNILNVALLARVFIFFAYPTYISGDEVWIAGLETTDKEGNILPDAYSGATILGFLANFESLTEPMRVYSTTAGEWAGMYAPLDIVFGFIPGSIGETNKIAILIGAIILLASGVGSWRIMVSVFVGAFVTSMLLNAVGGSMFLETPPQIQLILGGLAFGAVFMATDPVTACQTNTGKYIYGFFIGVFSIVIRVLNPAYPEGVMLAILFMNVFAPLIDHMVIQANIKRRLARAK